MDEREGHQQREELSEADVGFRGIAILLILFLLTAIAFLLMRDGVPGFGKSSFTDWILTIATISYVVVSYRMLMVIRAQLRATEKSNSLTLRAWLVIEDVIWSARLPRIPAEVFITVVVRNAGKLPAVLVRVMLRPETIPVASPAPTSYPDSIGPEGVVVAADQVKRFTFTIQDVPYEGLQTGADRLFFGVEAQIVYTDALGTKGKAIQYANYVRASAEHGEFLSLDREGGEIA